MYYWSNWLALPQLLSSHNSINPLRLGDAYMCQWTGSSLDQIMACCLIGTKPLSEPKLAYCQSDPKEHISMKFWFKVKSFQSRKCTQKYCLPNCGHFVSASMCWINFMLYSPEHTTPWTTPVLCTDEIWRVKFRTTYDDGIKWKHFQRYWPFVWGIHWSPVNSLHKSQWHRALMFSLICTWINGWVNNREDGDLRCHHAHYDVIVKFISGCYV